MMYNSDMPEETAVLIAVYILFMNLFSFLLFGIDKRRAKKNAWRISEQALLMSAFLSGAFGAYAGMKVFRHKTRHRLFTVLVPLAMILWLALTGWLLYSYFF